MNYSHFPLLCRGAGDVNGFTSAVDTIAVGLEENAVRSLHLSRARRALSRAIYTTYQRNVDRLAQEEAGMESPSPSLEFLRTLRLRGIDDVFSALSLVNESGLCQNSRNIVKPILEEAAPLAEAVERLERVKYSGTRPRQRRRSTQS